MAAITCAVAGGIAWGFLVDRFGARRTLYAVLLLWLLVFGMAAAVGAFALPIAWLYVVAGLAGIALGGIWSADRPLMLQLSPPARLGECYGLYGMVGRFAAITGPLLWAVIMHVAVERGGIDVLHGQALAISLLFVMTFVGFVI